MAENFLGIAGPAGMPAPVVERLNAVMAEVMADATITRRMDDLGVAGRRMSAAEFTRFVSVQVTEWAPALRASGAKLN